MASGPEIESFSPPPKKQKQHGIIYDLIDKFGERLVLVKEAVKSLSEGCFNVLFFLKMKSCNGCTGYGVEFSQAFCETEKQSEEFYPFYAVFTKGIEMLYNVLKNPGHADTLDPVSQELLVRLFTFLTDNDALTFIKDLERNVSSGTLSNETHIMVASAEHVFSNLTLRRKYTVDKTCKKDCASCMCQCGCETDINCRFGDTSVGESTVWHGYLDIILGHGEGQVPVLIPGDNESSPGCKAPVELKKNLSYHEIKHQMIAQVIVFSFLQKKLHPDSQISLIPTIGMSPKEIIFFFYDCKEDILMQSVKMPLQSSHGVCYSSLIAIWLAVNYKYLGCGLTGRLQKAPKSNFFTLAGEKLNIYKNLLTMGKVRGSMEEDTYYPFEVPPGKIFYPNEKPIFDL